MTATPVMEDTNKRHGMCHAQALNEPRHLAIHKLKSLPVREDF